MDFEGQVCRVLWMRKLRLARYMKKRLEPAVETLAAARLYVLLDGRASQEEFESLASQLIEAGVHAIQLRDKRMSDRDLLARAQALQQLADRNSTLTAINDRPDLAVLADVDAVHLGQDDLRIPEARKIVGDKMLIGVSTHSLDQARQAIADGADYIGVGPTFPSTTKDFTEFPGVAFLEQVVRGIDVPTFAIGGVKLERLPEVLATGIRRVAVSAAITAAVDPAQTAKEFLIALSDFGGAI